MVRRSDQFNSTSVGYLICIVLSNGALWILIDDPSSSVYIGVEGFPRVFDMGN